MSITRAFQKTVATTGLATLGAYALQKTLKVNCHPYNGTIYGATYSVIDLTLERIRNKIGLKQLDGKIQIAVSAVLSGIVTNALSQSAGYPIKPEVVCAIPAAALVTTFGVVTAAVVYLGIIGRASNLCESILLLGYPCDIILDAILEIGPNPRVP